jgi:hypothetical protein
VRHVLRGTDSPTDSQDMSQGSPKILQKLVLINLTVDLSFVERNPAVRLEKT